jgi:hypothetical protein
VGRSGGSCALIIPPHPLIMEFSAHQRTALNHHCGGLNSWRTRNLLILIFLHDGSRFAQGWHPHQPRILSLSLRRPVATPSSKESFPWHDWPREFPHRDYELVTEDKSALSVCPVSLMPASSFLGICPPPHRANGSSEPDNPRTKVESGLERHLITTTSRLEPL